MEPVVVRWNGEWLLSVGSDHTDRDLERSSIAASKAACPKVIGTTCLAVSAIRGWDDIEVASWLDEELEPYQSGTLRELLPLAELVAAAEQENGPFWDGDTMFLGTVPVIGGALRPSQAFKAEIKVPGSDLTLGVSYTVRTARETGGDNN